MRGVDVGGQKEVEIFLHQAIHLLLYTNHPPLHPSHPLGPPNHPLPRDFYRDARATAGYRRSCFVVRFVVRFVIEGFLPSGETRTNRKPRRALDLRVSLILHLSSFKIRIRIYCCICILILIHLRVGTGLPFFTACL